MALNFDNLTEEDKITILSALGSRIHSLWSIYPLSDRQRKLQSRYKLLFEKLNGDPMRYYEQELLKSYSPE